MKKKVLSILLALAMVFSLNAPVLAAGDGEPNTCTHENRIPVSYWQHSPKYIDTGSDKTHEVLGILLTQYYCPDCGEYLPGTTKEFCRETENHSYEDGMVCIACGHRNRCGHRNITGRWVQKGSVVYTDIGDCSLHEATVTMVYQERCDDCGLTRYPYEETNTYTESHSYDETGTCTECGYACPHEHVKRWYWNSTPVYTDTGDNLTHHVEYVYYSYEECSDCGYRLPGILEEPFSDDWIHEYDENGVCTLCGHAITPVTIRTAAAKGGTAEGAGTYEFRSFVYLTAIPAENYAFAGWYEDGCLVSRDEVYVFQAENDRTLQPSFLRTAEIPVKPAASFKAAEPVVREKNTDIPERSLLKK